MLSKSNNTHHMSNGDDIVDLPQTFVSSLSCGRHRDGSFSDVDFSDNFEDPTDDTDCDSLTTELSSVVTLTNATPSPPLLARYFKSVGCNLENDSWSSQSSVVDVVPGEKLSYERTSPDGVSSPDACEEIRRYLYCDSPQLSVSKTKFPLFLPLSTPLFPLGSNNTSSETLYRTGTAVDTQSDNTPPAHEVRSSNRLGINWKLQSKQLFSSVDLHDDNQQNVKCPADDTNLDASERCNSVTKRNETPPNMFRSTDGLDVTEQEVSIRIKSSNVSIVGSTGRETDTDSTDSFRYVTKPRSFSLPNVNFAMRHLNCQKNLTNPDLPNSTKTSDMTGHLLMNRNRETFRLKSDSHTNECNTYGPLVSGSHSRVSIFDSNRRADQMFPRGSRRQIGNISNSIAEVKDYCQTIQPLKVPSSQNMRKHLPNPFNKINHRFHSTLHCPCFIFFCFLCCYPAVFLMQRSDIQFISGDDDLARKSGKRSTMLYIIGGISSVLFISTLLFVVYYFLGEDLIKTE